MCVSFDIGPSVVRCPSCGHISKTKQEMPLVTSLLIYGSLKAIDYNKSAFI